jgi:ribosomal protein S18 acetylase RimI-like enzyme
MNKISLRTASPEDKLFYFRVYASTRTEEMALVNWTAEQKDSFLWMQFNAQTEHYRLNYPTAEYQVILREGVSAGRLITERTKDQLLIMDISILPEYRNHGIGTAIIQDLKDEAAQSGVPLVLRVEYFNPVIRLYTRLGFEKTREVNSVYQEMVWKPAMNRSKRADVSSFIQTER